MSDKSKRRTVKDIDHTHPHTDEPFGSWAVFDRGTSSGDDAEHVEADPDDESATDRVSGDRDRSGDRRRNGANRGTADGGPRLVKDIDHTPPDEVGAQRTFDRGDETPVPDRRPDDEDDEAV